MLKLVGNISSSFKCTACAVLSNQVYEHRILKVSLCKTCYDSLKDVDRNNDRCVWCGSDNDHLVCVQCEYKCCVACIVRNLDSHYITAVNEKNWLCFVCDSDPIKDHQREYQRLATRDTDTAAVPDATRSTIEITSPHIALDDECNEDREHIQRDNSMKQCQDLDVILNAYEKQIQSSLELDDANIPAIIREINSIKTEQLSSAINSYKRCLNAFMSDLTNLEARVTQSESYNNASTAIKLTSLLKILIQHHIFNRICHPQSRIKDDLTARLSDRGNTPVPIKKVVSTTSSIGGASKSVVMLIDPTNRRNIVLKPHKFERKDAEVNEMVSKIKNLCNKQRFRDDGEFDQNEYIKRLKLTESVEGTSRRNRNPATPSWLSDYKVEKESEYPDSDGQEMSVDQDWTDPRVKRLSDPGRRGRPPKYRPYSVADIRDVYCRGEEEEEDELRRNRGRPKKTLFINMKQPRYCIQKKNGETLASSM